MAPSKLVPARTELEWFAQGARSFVSIVVPLTLSGADGALD